MTRTNCLTQNSKIFLVFLVFSAYPSSIFIAELVKNQTAREVLENKATLVPNNQEFLLLSHEVQRQHLVKVCHLSKTLKDLSGDERTAIFNATYFDRKMIYDGKRGVAYCPIPKV